MDPTWGYPHGFLGWTHWMGVMMGWSDSPEESVREAFQCAQKALSLNESPMAHALLGWLYALEGDYEKAISEGERSIALDPNSADAHIHYAYTLILIGSPEKSLSLIEKGLRLNPFPYSWYFVVLGTAYRFLGRNEEGTKSYKKAISIEPTSLIAHLGLSSAFGLDGREREACLQAEEVLRIEPKFSLERYAKALAFKNQAARDRIVTVLRKAGLK